MYGAVKKSARQAQKARFAEATKEVLDVSQEFRCFLSGVGIPRVTLANFFLKLSKAEPQPKWQIYSLKS